MSTHGHKLLEPGFLAIAVHRLGNARMDLKAQTIQGTRILAYNIMCTAVSAALRAMSQKGSIPRVGALHEPALLPDHPLPRRGPVRPSHARLRRGAVCAAGALDHRGRRLERRHATDPRRVRRAI